jgi:N-acetylmuramoyl-L-alanine amidase
LIEGGFMSNMSEAKQIATPAYRQRLAEAIADGLSDYRSTLEKLRTAGKGASP